MTEYLLLRFDAPLMSFGSVMVDQRGSTQEFPGRSLLAGLLGNALGLRHRDFGHLNRLQERLRYGVRRDRAGQTITDFQTVDLGQPFLQSGWTTRGKPQSRGGGTAREATHIRYREYVADAVYTVALTLEPGDEEPSLDDLEAALREPARPLFLGRKPCLPSRPLLLDPARVVAESPVAAVVVAPLDPRADAGASFKAWWAVEETRPEGAGEGRPLPVFDDRDWENQVHTGRRFVWEGMLRVQRQESPPPVNET